MILSKKIMLLPTPEQIILLKKSAGTARWSYNYMLSRNNESDRFINERDIRKEITLLKKTDEYSWLKEVSANIPKQACKDCQNAYNRMFKGQVGKPKFKKKGFKDSFYVNYESFHKTQNGCHIEKIGSVKTVEQVPILDKYLNPRVVFDNKYWYITFSYEVEDHKENLSKNRPLGIDLGIKTFVTTSDNQFFDNINKTRYCRLLYKRLKKLNRKLSRCKKGSNNRRKVITQIQITHRKLANIRRNYIHQITAYLVKTKPSKIVVEYLKVSNMLKNRKLSREISQCGFYEFRRMLEYKCKFYGIGFQLANQFFPSSKICSVCGNKKSDLRLNDRIYECDCCGVRINRDFNAAVNLSRL